MPLEDTAIIADQVVNARMTQPDGPSAPLT